MLIQPTCLEPNFFCLILQFGRAYAKVGRRSHDSTLFLKLTGTWTHDRTSPHPWPHLDILTYTYDHIYFELNKFFSYFIKISVTVNFFFSDYCLPVHYCYWQSKMVRGRPKSHPVYRKLPLLRMGQKPAKTKAMDTLPNKSSNYCWG